MALDAVLPRILETARAFYLEGHQGEFTDGLVKEGKRSAASRWMQDNPADIEQAVRYAGTLHGVEADEVLREVKAALKIRILSGVLTLPVSYVGQDELPTGRCNNTRFDKETGAEYCEVAGEQAKAWHKAYGCSPICPFCDFTPKTVEELQPETELDKLLSEGVDIGEALRRLGY
jgi:glutaredoxin